MKHYFKEQSDYSSASKTTVNLRRLIAASTLALTAHPVLAQTTGPAPTIESIPTFDDSALVTGSDAVDISGDGSVVVGYASDSAITPRAFAYSGGTLVNLAPAMGDASFARGASEDGSVITGVYLTAGTPTMFYWTQATGAVAIPISAGVLGEANGISADGTRIVGTIFDNGAATPAPPGPTSPAPYDRAFVWTRATNTFVTLPSLVANGDTYGADISDNGTIVVGRAETATTTHAFRAVVGGAITDLGTIGGAAGQSRANGVSGDGQVVVGQSVAPSVTGQRAFRWSAGTGMVQLASTDEANVFFSLANAANQDGSYVAGAVSYTTAPGSYRALRWDADGVALDLGDLTSDNSGTSSANGISADGSVVVGVATNDAGDSRGFIWRDVENPDDTTGTPGGTMLDHINTLTQVSDNAAQQAAGAHYVDKLVQFTLGQSLELPIEGSVGQRSKRGLGHPFSIKVNAGAASNRDGNDTALAGLIAATALTDNLSLGGFLGLGTDDDTLTGFGIDGTFRSFGVYLQGGHPATEGLNWKLAAAQSAAEVEITRSTALPNTERGLGRTDMRARAGSIEVGYGMQRGAALVTPFLRVSRSSVDRDGYTETNAVAFPVTYDDYEVSATTATLGADVRIPVSAAGVVRLKAGVEWDLSRSTDTVSGTSAIPGMTSFAIAGPALEHEERLFAEARYTHALGNGRSYDLGLGVHQTPYAEKPSVMATIGYQMDF
ncbi:autotransporter domain-containing protein [Aliiroseovarius sp. S2029]|uniref:autotransporter domain-containing protein n=1 Tax=Aliiroseovarius sp. S2029 TaxID=2936988 RepID=UPI0020C0A59E|nr:autotransporter domain-containing protein [Aliiroseovarius sp. S2029]MCK8482687.1 autotransporter domain-containing protein [Aliiroseovarius sp. S2029]